MLSINTDIIPINIKSEFSKSLKFLFFVTLGYGLMFLSQIQFNLFVIYSLLIFSIVSITILIKPFQGLYLFVFFAILSETHYLYGVELFHSIYTFKIGGFSLIDLLLFLILFRTIIEFFLEGSTRFRVSPWDIGFLVISALFIVASIWGFIFDPSIRNWLVDVKSILFFVTPFFLVRFYLRDEKKVFSLFKVVAITLFAKTIVYFIGYLIQFTLYDYIVIRVTLSSDGIFYPLLLLLCITGYIIADKKIQKFSVMLIGIITALVLFWSFWREAWFWTGVSILLFITVSDKDSRSTIIKAGIVGAIVMATFISILRPQTWEYAITSIMTYSLNPKGKGESESGAIRGIEWINVHNLLVDTRTVLVGRGMGATWSDRYHPLPRRFDVYSFPLNETEHVMTHMIMSKIYLKIGLLGSFIFWLSLLLPWFKNMVQIKKLKPEYKYFLLAFLISLIGIFAKLELMRVALIGGFIMGGFSTIYLAIQQKYSIESNRQA